MPSAALLEAVAVTAELCGRTFSEPAARVFVSDLSAFAEPAVMRALGRCRREIRGVLTVHDVVSRIDDGRPGPEEAWAMIPRDEAGSVVWTAEMASAYGIACRLDDPIAARMAFKEAYTKAVNDARDSGIPVSWTPSLGHDPGTRDAALMEAVEKGRLTYEHAQELVPQLPAPPKAIAALLDGALKRLPA